MTKLTVGNAQLVIRGLVRDKDGRPKFDDPQMIKDFMHRLTAEDIEYLKGIFDGKYFHTDSSST